MYDTNIVLTKPCCKIYKKKYVYFHEKLIIHIFVDFGQIYLLYLIIWVV